jgi:uncharacterized protein
MTPDAARPVADPADRIVTLDILRGFALFGMIFVHFHQEFRLTTEGVPRYFGEGRIGTLAWMGVEQKAWGTFAFLFGVGFAVLMRRAEQRQQPVVAFYLRRLATLALIALALDVLTGFTVLLEYAMWGVPLLFIRRWPTPVLLGIAILSASSWAIEPFSKAVYQWVTLGREGADHEMASRAPARRNVPPPPPQTYAEFVGQQAMVLKTRVTRRFILYPTSSFALFIIGVLAVRRGIFDAPRRHVRVIVAFMVLGLASWAVFWWGLPRLPIAFAPRAAGTMMKTGLGIVNEQWLAFTYIGGLVLLLTYRPQWTRRLAPIGTAGRMALTNYVIQCVVIFLLSSPLAIGLHLRPYYYTLGAIALFAASVLFSRVWLARFRFGPLEWGWRSATTVTSAVWPLNSSFCMPSRRPFACVSANVRSGPSGCWT